MIEVFEQWATASPDAAYLVGFSVIVAASYGLVPYELGLNVATSKDIPFKFIDVRRQIKKRHRLGLSLAAIVVFAFFHFALGAPLMALVAGAALVGALVVTDYNQIERDSGPVA